MHRRTEGRRKGVSKTYPQIPQKLTELAGLARSSLVDSEVSVVVSDESAEDESLCPSTPGVVSAAVGTSTSEEAALDASEAATALLSVLVVFSAPSGTASSMYRESGRTIAQTVGCSQVSEDANPGT